ncbi:hypothetical protein [Gordonia sp. 852002-10350_SCH5691597]|uniref:hypothetical protein n=1 Tax=Gordonia sp. 852002-10350_SCH5691597 TaxID=1834085 RepID=UPI0007EBB307|nr:hypothetical protein [Gordonia sp. 852002-10350_SCH5691597]OBA56902.1 hypothetical protein A5777_07825 [Gordonia sp. 852002-10350_SCH5691597]
MNPEDAVVDEIDRLVEESLTKPWHQVSGYDNNIGQPRCRCGADWHGLPTTFCPGSDTEGPLPPISALEAAMRRISRMFSTLHTYDTSGESDE